MALYTATGIPEFTTSLRLGRSCQPSVEIRTNGRFVMQMTPLGVDEKYSTTSVANGIVWITGRWTN